MKTGGFCDQAILFCLPKAEMGAGRGLAFGYLQVCPVRDPAQGYLPSMQEKGGEVNKHTPGPWRVEAGAKAAYRVIASSKRGLPKSVCQVAGFFAEAREANADLISAAPDLLDAAKHLLMCGNLDGPESCEGCSQAVTAITKAEGL